MQQEQLEGLVVFTVVAETKSFSAAAARLGVSASAVSQSVRQLEKRLGLVLFNRTTRSVSLTDIGSRFLQRVQPAISELAAASEELGKEAAHPSGWLRLNVPRAGYMIALQPVLKGFMDQYPDVKVEVCIENALVDIVGRGFDAGIRFGNLVEKDMIGVSIGPPITAFIVGSPEYFKRHGVPAHPRDLVGHDCVGFRHVTTGMVERWKFARDDEAIDIAVDGRFVINDAAALVQAGLDGLGLVYMISGYVERFIEQGRLVRVLEDWSPVLPGLTLYYPDRKRVPAKLRVLIDYLKQHADIAATPEAWLR
jgi:DNA-binding transcriptional LysR family regulator